MAKRKRTNMVTRRVVEGRVIDVYEFKNGQITKLDTIEVTGKINEKALAEKYGVEKVMVDTVKEIKGVYGVDIDTFMSLAVKLEDDVEEAELSNETETEEPIDKTTSKKKSK